MKHGGLLEMKLQFPDVISLKSIDAFDNDSPHAFVLFSITPIIDK
jgi:hypothetical protein